MQFNLPGVKKLLLPRPKATDSLDASAVSARALLGPPPETTAAERQTRVGEILSTWIVAPLMFLFLLWDTGEIKQGLLRAVPNRPFEPALTRAIPTMTVFEGLAFWELRRLARIKV
jgi:predicted PurR-regulated permease PerM